MKSLSLSKPHLIVMVGAPGAGKSFFAEHFAETFKAPLVSWKQLQQRMFSGSDANLAAVSAASSLMLDELFKTHRTILFEGESHLRTQRQELQKRATAAGYETLFIWVQTDAVTTKSRAKKQGTDPATFERILKRFTPPKATEPVVVISGKHTYASQLKVVLRRLVEPRAVLAGEPADRIPISPRQSKLIR